MLAASTSMAVVAVGALTLAAPVTASAGAASQVAPEVAAKKATKKAKKNKKNKKAKKYALGGDAYGTQIKGGELGVSSGRTAHSYVHCNTQTKTNNTSLVGGRLLPNDSLLKLGLVTTSVKARKGAKAARKEGFPKGTRAGSVATSAVTDIELAGIGDIRLGIKGLETEARAWVTKKGKFKTAERYTGGNIALTGLTGTPLDDVLNGLPINQLIDLLLGRVVKDLVVNEIVNGVLTIAGLGEIKMDKQVSKVTKKKARSAAKALEVRLYGTNGKGADDIIATIGGTSARVHRGAENGLFGGGVYGLKTDVLGGVITTAKLADRPLPCTGTDGKWVSTGVAGIDLLKADLIKVDGVKSSVRTTGKNKKKKRTATARSQTARVQVGPASTGLVIEAVRSQVKVIRKPKAKPGRKLTRKYNVDLGDIYLGGRQIDLDQLLNPVLGGVDDLLKAARIASVKVGVRRKTKNGGGITAIQIKLLDGRLADIVVGNAEARIRK